MTGAAGVDDCQTAMTETRATSGVVNRLRSPNAFIVTTTMLDRLQHPGEMSLRLEAD
jgi:hypothetical protein